MSRKACTVRERHDDDLPALAALLVRVHAEDSYPVEGVTDPIGWLQHPRELRSWTALLDDVPIGQVTLTTADLDDDAARVWIDDTGDSVDHLVIIVRLFVDPEHRSVGAGRTLLDAALGHARQIGLSAALDVMIKDRAAIRLYERQGGRRLCEIVHNFGDGLTEPAVVFVFPADSLPA